MHSPQNEYSGVIVSLVRALAVGARTGETTGQLADRLRLPAPAARILRAATAAGTLADPAWAEQLADLQAASSVFLQGLGNRSAFAALLDLGVLTRAPLRSRITAVAEAALGEMTGEGKATAVSKMTLSGDTLVPRLAQATVVLSREIVENSSAASQAFVSRQLRRAVARALDAGFFASLLSSSTPTFSSTGNHVADLMAMLDATNSGEGRLAWVASTSVANRLALLLDGRGDASPQGLSEFVGLPMAVSPGLDPGVLLLIDGDKIAANIESLGVDVARHAALQMDTEPTMDSVTPTATATTSLWQTNAVGIRLSALFGAVAGTADAMAVLTGVDWPPVVSG